MSAPLKPWERSGVNFRASSNEMPPSNMFTSNISGAGPAVSSTPQSSAPPVPARPNAGSGPGTLGPTSSGMGYYGSYSSYPYSSGYNSYSSYGSPYSYGGIGSYGLGSYGYGRPGFGGPSPDNRFIAAAEESSRNAFASLESIVQAFSSISMMLDSTLNAVYSSFRAVLGMADQFSRLRTHLSKVFSALAIFRTAKWAMNKLLYLIGLRKVNPSRAAWSQALNEIGALTEADIKKPVSSWPITLFLAIIVSAPYFIWRIVSSLESNGEGGTGWASGEGEHYVARAEYDFTAAREGELSFRSGQTLRLAPRNLQPRVQGWVLAATDATHRGLVPVNYLKIMSKAKNAQVSNQ